MADEIEALILDLVEWLAQRPRPYPEVMEAWRTSCPRLPVWEEAVDRGLVCRRCVGATPPHVAATARGLRLLEEHGRAPDPGVTPR